MARQIEPQINTTGWSRFLLKAGGELMVLFEGNSKYVVDDAVLIVGGKQYAVEFEGSFEKLPVVKAKASRLSRALQNALDRQARLKSGLPIQAPDDVKPAGCLL